MPQQQQETFSNVQPIQAQQQETFSNVTPISGAQQDTSSIEPGFKMNKQGTRHLNIPNAIHLDPQAIQQANRSAIKATTSGIAATVAPELLPEMGPIATWLARAGAVGPAAAIGNSAGQAITGQNPLTVENAKESATTGALTSGSELLFGALPLLGKTKLGRMLVNRSLGAVAKDVTFGNPAKAMEDVTSPFTGDIEKFKASLRAGQPLDQAEVAAGGRFGQISQKIQTLAPQLDAAIQGSRATVRAVDVIDAPLNDAAIKIINNSAMLTADKDAALTQLGSLQKELHANLGPDLTMSDVLRVKRDIGNEVNNWTVEPRTEIQDAYRKVYGSLKDALHSNVPGAAKLDEDLTNAIAAKGAVERLARAQEVGKGNVGNFGTTWLQKLEGIVGNLIPGGAKVSRAAAPATAAVAAGASTQQ